MDSKFRVIDSDKTVANPDNSPEISTTTDIVDIDVISKSSGNTPMLPPTELVNIPAFQEKVRAGIASILLGSLLITIFGVWIYVAFHSDEDKNIQLINLIWTSQVTLISGAFGFYFGSKN